MGDGKRVVTEKLAYTISEVVESAGFSRNTVTRLFEHEKGVLVLSHPEEMHKRRYRSIRIPAPSMSGLLEEFRYEKGSQILAVN